MMFVLTVDAPHKRYSFVYWDGILMGVIDLVWMGVIDLVTMTGGCFLP